MTNNDQIQGAVDWLINAGAVPFTIASCIIISYFFRYLPIFPNKWIPVVCILVGPVIFPLLNPKAADLSNTAFYIHSIVGGFFIGILAWLIHDKWISKFESKVIASYPKTAIVLTKDSADTTSAGSQPTTTGNK